MTPDLSPLCHPSTGLSGGFVGASSVNGHPADRHVVYPPNVMGGERGYAGYVLAVKSKWMTSMFGF